MKELRGGGHERAAGRRGGQPRSNATTSPSSGKRPRDRLEKTVLPSTVTSNTPPCEAISSLSIPSSLFSSAAKLTARGL